MKRKKLQGTLRAGVGDAIKEKLSGILPLEPGKIAALAPPVGIFLISWLLSFVRAPMGTYPFSYGAVAAASGGMAFSAAFAGAVLAAPLMDTGALPQILVLLGLLLCRIFACFVKGDFKDKRRIWRKVFRERGYIRVIFAALGAAAYGCVTIATSESIYYGLFSALLGIGEGAIVSAAFIFLGNRRANRSKRLAGFLILVAGVAMAAEGFGLPFSLAAVLTFLASVYFSYAGSAAIGCCVGIAGGIAVGGAYVPAFGSVGLILALMWEHSRIGSVVTAALTASVLALFGGGLDAISDVIPELALAAAVACPFVSLGPIPERLPSFLDFENGQREIVLTKGSSSVSERYSKIGKALESLSGMLFEVGNRMKLPTKQEAHRICTSVRAKYCSGCANEGECSGRDRNTVDSMFANMEFRLTSNGRVTARIVPEGVARRCYNMDPILESINRAVRKNATLSGGGKRNEMFASDYKALATLIREINESTEAEADKQAQEKLSKALSERGFSFASSSVYGGRSKRVYMRGVDLRSATAGEDDIRRCAESVVGGRLSSPDFSLEGGGVNASMHTLPVIGLTSGKYSVRSLRDNATGDSVCTFENAEGYHYTLVSDGMGSGREAAITSGISATFLEKLLVAGCPMRSTLELLNCFVRGGEGECFTTVDLMEADLYTGMARFIKSGAAPSFIIRKGQLYRIHSKTVPVGIMRALDAEAVSFELRAGDTVVMMSDGVCGSYEECPWLYDILSGGIFREENPAAAAKMIAEAAAEMTGRDDDITVCVLKVEAA